MLVEAFSTEYEAHYNSIGEISNKSISRLYPLENLWPSLWGAVMIAFERLGYSLTTFFSHGGETGPHYLCSTVESLESSTA